MSASMPQSFNAGPAPSPGVFADGRGEGLADKSRGMGFRATMLMSSERALELTRREGYFTCRQHDWKSYDFDGRAMQPGRPYSQPLLNSEVAPFYVPLRMRRPSSPYRLGRVIVRSFTTMLFGEGHWPKFTVPGDEDTQDFAEALIEATALPAKMMRARDIGGGCGTVGLSWCYHQGKPQINVHAGRNCHVLKWANREELVPAHVVELYQFTRDEYDPIKNKVTANRYWYRRDYTEDADIYFKEAPVQSKNTTTLEPDWVIDQELSYQHNDGECHFVWVQNREAAEEDGYPDYDGCYENLDFLDILYSVLGRGTVVNLDPTLVLKMDLDYVQRMGIKKGSDNALTVGLEGDASYLEIGGSSVDAGLKLFESQRRSTLETAQCIVLDPATLAANGTSSVAIKMIYASMTSACDDLREQYGTAVVRLLTQMIKVAQARYREKIVVEDEEGKDVPAQFEVQLPRRVIQEPVLGPDGQPTGEETTVLKDRVPGEGTQFKLVWGQWFPPTPTDQSAVVTSLTAATGGKAFMSPKTAIEIAAGVFGRDPQEEIKRMAEHSATEEAKQAEMFAEDDAAGKVDPKTGAPSGKGPQTGLPGDEDEVDPDDEDEDADAE